MTMDKSLKMRRGLARARSVLNRAERIQRLKAADRWQEGDQPLWLGQSAGLQVGDEEEEEEEGRRGRGRGAAAAAAAPAADAGKKEAGKKEAGKKESARSSPVFVALAVACPPCRRQNGGNSTAVANGSYDCQTIVARRGADELCRSSRCWTLAIAQAIQREPHRRGGSTPCAFAVRRKGTGEFLHLSILRICPDRASPQTSFKP